MARLNVGGLTSRRPFTFLGILLAILVIAAFVLVAINASTGQSTAQQSVVVASKDLSPRVPIDASAIEMKSIPVAGYPASLFFHNTDDVKGMIPLVTIVAGEPITANVIAKPGASLGSQSEYLPIPSGYVALQLPTSDLQGVGGNIQPDDYISVIATVTTNGKVATKTIFHDVHVIRVGSAAANTSSASTATSLTVVVTYCQAEYITWFLSYASLKYELESYHDYQPSSSQAADPNCPGITSAKGVTLQAVQAAFPSLF
ncbi:MAG TPA: Flp pilus assembly protein CpaB [Candidatus Dormibacteraeota bacterium]|nr:Flp pilus assembly protein CpaB [Candidatus Dormibacteraeota bacterium]